MKVTFTEKEFDVFRKFQNKMNAVFGESAYVGTTYSMVQLEYSPSLNNMLRPPMPKDKNLEFEVKFLACEDCKGTMLFLCLPHEDKFVCYDCSVKRNNKKR